MIPHIDLNTLKIDNTDVSVHIYVFRDCISIFVHYWNKMKILFSDFQLVFDFMIKSGQRPKVVRL